MDRVLAQTVKEMKADLRQVQSRLTEKEEEGCRDATALDLVWKQLDPDPGTAEVRVDELTDAVKKASEHVRVVIFNEARKARKKGEVGAERAIPIFRALAESDHADRFHRNYGPLGYALKDQRPPAWADAEAALTKAIAIRDKQGQAHQAGIAKAEIECLDR